MSVLSKFKGWFGKSASPGVAAFLNGGDDSDSGRGAKVMEPYPQSIWVYTAINTIARSLSQIPFRISQVGADQARRVRSLRDSSEPKQREFCRRALSDGVIDSGEVVDLFNRPHPTMDRALFMQLLVTWECLRGEFFVLPLDGLDAPVDLEARGAKIKSLLTLSPDLFWHNVQGYELVGWRYTGSPLLSPLPSEMLLPSEVVHGRSVNPGIYWRGLSPLSAARVSMDSDYAASLFMKGLLINNADTGVIVTTDQNPSDDQRLQIAAALRERKRKAGTPDRPLFLWGGAKVEKPTVSNVDMQFIETRGLLRNEILAIYNTPASILGFSEAQSSGLNNNGGALNEDKLNFVDNNLEPRCRAYEAAFAPIIASFGEGLVGWFDLDSLPIRQAARRARVDTAVKLFNIGVPFNDLNARLDLGLPEYAWHKTGYLPFNLQPATEMATPAPAEDDPTLPPPKDDGDKDGDKGVFTLATDFMQRLALPASDSGRGVSPLIRIPNTAALWRRHMRARATTVKHFSSVVGKVLNNFRASTLRALATVHLEDKALSFASRGLIDLIFSPNEFGAALVAALDKPQKAALNQAGKEAKSEIGSNDPWEMPPEKATEFIKAREQSIMGVGGTVRDQLNTSLEAGYNAGETTAELSDRVRSVFTNLTKGEAVRVARTETNLAFNYARQDALDDAGIEYKSWLSSHGPTVREGHAEAEDTYMDAPIPLNEPFVVVLDGIEEQMMFPGDGDLGASAGNIINCQCIHLAAEKQDEDEKGAWFKVFGLGRIYFPRRVAGDVRQLHHCSHV